MVVVSDDVHEYAVALKDTEEKIARCPARVRHYCGYSKMKSINVQYTILAVASCHRLDREENHILV